ncbi:PD40 domain-containing protein [Cohnella luojiensis]|uniref:Translocation protein TolB n=1 Tax=Cohnella luojiensis TaxID=652876 RepID=A0A4Y8LT36_9BACL|nr:PD40 domain-containing protein [Cohnella luojiensis]TFE24537.1 translocation protein TolB [Cohnella luojiensis]
MRAMKKICLVLAALSLCIMLGLPLTVSAKPAASLKAAFVRGGDLWMKAGGIEQQLTKGDNVRNPKWSFDGEWIAYARGEDEQELRVWHVPTGKSELVSERGGSNFQWSPDRNRLAFLLDRKLVWVRPDKPDEQMEAANGISNYSWLPNGNGFVASGAAELLPEGWTPVPILEIPLNEPNRVKTLYVLPKQSDDFFAVGTSEFKFSPSGRWMAFLATPTASLSADSNTLVLLSADGAFFRKVDRMANNKDWFKWSDRKDRLAYIGGVGREATSNKQLRVLEAPEGKPVTYTPAGYVDQSFTWEGMQHVVVSRAKERKPSDGSAAQAPDLPKLVEIKLQGRRDKPITEPPKRFGDFNPQFLQRVDRLAWVRSNQSIANVLLSGRSGKQPSIYIKNIDLGANFYQQWRWSDVLSFHS